jgi:hypothetical protein
MDQDFSEFVQLLLANDVRFLIIGGYALAAHGAPRYTGDLDTWVWLDHVNAERIIQVLKEFGFGSLEISREDFLLPKTVIQLGFPPHRIDLLTGIDGIQFEEAWPRREVFDIGGLSVPFISRQDLITNKKAVARPQDLADVAKLEGSH